MPDQQPLKIFIVYAREDADALKELRVQFIPVAKSENLVVWYDGEILPGQHWDREIKTQLQSADIILLFISKYFFASEYIQTTELKEALARHEAGKSVVVPVIVRPCVWQDAFDVSQFQALPTGAQPIFSTAWRDHDEAMVTVVEGVKKVTRRLRENRSFEKRNYEPTQIIAKQKGAQRFVYIFGGFLTLLFIFLWTTYTWKGVPEDKEEPIQDVPILEVKQPKNSLEMVHFMSGELLVGSTGEVNNYMDSCRFRVDVPSFNIGKYEVTQFLWKKIMGNNPSISSPGCDDCPVNNVSYYDIQTFLDKLNAEGHKKYRLPSEQEWEYAAKDGFFSNAYIYAGSDNIDDVAWYLQNSGGQAHVVGTKNSNKRGLFDMSGNVQEWCSTKYKPYSGCDGHECNSCFVVRGGGWGLNSFNCRASYRKGESPAIQSSQIGFRLAHD